MNDNIITDTKENLIRRFEILQIYYNNDSHEFFKKGGKSYMPFDEYALKNWNNVDMNYFESIG